MWLKAISLGFLTTFATLGYATQISLDPQDQVVDVGQTFEIDLLMDFIDDSTLGGGIDVFYDEEVLDFVSFSFDAGLGDDPAFRFTAQDLPGEVNEIGFGSFGGLTGPATIGTLTFDALAAGTTDITLGINDTSAGGFFSAVTFNSQVVTLQGARVAVVPEPAIVWLLVPAIFALGFARARPTRNVEAG